MIYKQVQQSTYLLDYAGQRFLVDPIMGGLEKGAAKEEIKFSDLLDVDAVIATHALDRIQRIKQLLKIAACTHIGDERHTFIAFGCRQTDLREARYEGDRQIIDAVIA